MPKPLRMSRRTWVAAWAVLCAAGIVATAALDASSAPDPRPEDPVGAECAEYIADVETQLAEAGKEGMDDGVPALTRRRAGAEDCGDELRDQLNGDR
ncbi:hypothetical protein [Streptomyces sp. NPDC018947]|uniref:hypothetical protein n=1 Tax=Streptomyces sp. NPDC018947 TaxID=3365054 RepID=UPI0037A11A14